MPMMDPARMTSTEICNVTTTPCRRRGSSSITESIGPPLSHRPPNPPLDKTEQRGERVGGDKVENACHGPRLDELERVGHKFAGDEGQLGNGDGHGQRRVLEERDERVAERGKHRADHDRQGDVAGNLEPAESEGTTGLDEGTADAKDAGAEYLG